MRDYILHIDIDDMMDLIEDYAFACVRGDWADRRGLRDKIESDLCRYDKNWHDQINEIGTENYNLRQYEPTQENSL